MSIMLLESEVIASRGSLWWILLLALAAVIAFLVYKHKQKNKVDAPQDNKQPEKSRTNTAPAFTDSEKRRLEANGVLSAVMTAYRKAQDGDTEAMLFLGLVYNQDLNDAKKSFRWMKMSADRGNAEALYFLGTYYADGYGVEKDRAKGIHMILESASQGNPDAIDCCREKMEMTDAQMRECGIPV